MQKATRQDTKEHNLRLVLRTIYGQPGISRADVARITKLTPTTVSELVAGLMGEGLIEEKGPGESLGGKPPILLSLIEDARFVICLDLSGDSLRGALINLRGQIAGQVEIPIGQLRGEAVLGIVYSAIDQLLASANGTVVGIGVGTPGIVEAGQGIIRQAVNLGWQDMPLVKKLSVRYGLPVHIANDSQVTALAEYTFGERKGTPNLVLIKSGQGIGSGILINHQLYAGETFGAGEIGHLVIEPGGTLCSCGNRGCLEAVAGRRAIITLARRLGSDNPASALAATVGLPDEQALQVLIDAVHANDPLAAQLVRKIGHAYGIGIASLVSVLNIRTIMLDGDVASLGPEFIESARQELSNRVLSTLAGETEILCSTATADIVLLGASALVFFAELGLP